MAGEIGHATDLSWTPTYRHVELVLNGQYEGIYQFTEQIKVASGRVDITKMGPDDNSGEALTGGYLLELDDRLEENKEPGFRTRINIPVVVKDPDPMTAEQLSYIRNYVQAFEDALYAPDGPDPVTGCRAYLDTTAYADQYLVQEITRNQDAFWSSTYFTKERGVDTKLRFGPIWDFDASMGTTALAGASPPTGWQTKFAGDWNRKLFTDPTFVQEVVGRWDSLKPFLDLLPDRIEALGDSLGPAIDNDQTRWFRYTPLESDTPDFSRTGCVSRSRG